ncbi:MAG TPA: DUF3822 family protein [Draconibacterium sp.]|nr:DUF3822 family protein [Draconibacterium sp.]
MSDFINDGLFEIAKTKNYILSIQVCLDGFSFLIVDPREKQVVAIKNSPIKISNENLLARHLKEWLTSEALFKNQFESVSLLYYSENFTLVPEEFYAREKQKNLASLLFDKKLSGNIIENIIENLSLALLFPVPQEISNVLNQFFKSIEILHPVTNVIRSYKAGENGILSFILLTKKCFHLVAFENDKLKLASSFQIQHPNDLVYNVINSFQQIGLARSETSLFIVSAIDQNTETESLLKPYFNKVGILKTEEFIAGFENLLRSV